jgi:phosphomannomutase/phosphoglucomutase
MFPKPKPALTPNTYAYESEPLVKPTGFREYDVRWLLEKEINLMGVQALGLGLGTLIHELGASPRVVTGHDFRAYSASVKAALTTGLMAAGCSVHDIGLALTPMAYFAQFALEVPCVAMVTASHNDNGWTGVKMGASRPLTFGPDEINRLKAIVLEARFKLRDGGAYTFVENFPQRYIADLTQRGKLKRRLKVVCACGNGTAGAFAPRVLSAIGCEVAPLDCELDHTFPKYNPNTEDMKMLHAMRDEVLRVKADVALGFDGDGDRCGVVDNEGEEIFADKVGVMLARDISAQHKGATFVADVKSTGLFMTDPVLRANGAKADYWKTGHSYMKRLKTALPKTWSSPTMAPHCPDEVKYRVVDDVVAHFQQAKTRAEKVAGAPIRDLVTVNGVRVTLEDGTWGLVRASSNKPELVVVVESPVSEARMREMFKALDAVLRTHREVGAYNQTI